jgi:hypothetical protein
MKNNIICPFFFEEPSVAGKTFLATMEDIFFVILLQE